MENKFIVAFLFGAIVCFCSAEFTADMVYDILSGKLDVLFFSMKGMKKDIDDISDKIETIENQQNRHQNSDMKTLFESLKAEMNDKFKTLEAKIIRKVDELVQDALVSINEAVNNKVSEIDRKRSKESDKLEINMIRKFLLSEKVALRKLNYQFEVDSRKKIKDMTDLFEGRIQDIEQIVALFTNRNEIRMLEVENKMFAFKNASWKGERGDIGPVGQKGQRGVTGEKGDKGSKGESRSIGHKGQKGERGYTGHTESRQSVHFSVSLGENKIIYENTVVKFDNVLTNRGGGYNSSTGVFTAPYSSAYLFLFFVRPDLHRHDIAFFKLYVDGLYAAYTIQESPHDGYDGIAGQAYVGYMYAGQKAWIQTGDLTGDGNHDVHAFGTTFTGVLI